MANKHVWKYFYFYKDIKGDSFHFEIRNFYGQKMANLYAVQHAICQDNYVEDSLTYVTKRMIRTQVTGVNKLDINGDGIFNSIELLALFAIMTLVMVFWPTKRMAKSVEFDINDELAIARITGVLLEE